MFVRAEWRSESGVVLREGRVRIANGVALWRLSVEHGRGTFNLYYEPRNDDSYVSSTRSTSVGVLGLLRDSLPEMDGTDASVSVTAIGREWIDASDDVLEFFASLGVNANIRGRTLEVRGNASAGKLISQVGVCLVALDVRTRQALSSRALDELRFLAAKEFEYNSEEILRLFDEHDGKRRVKELLGGIRKREEHRQRDARILQALRKLNPQAITQFDCGSGWFLRRLCEEFGAVAGIEPSLRRVERLRSRWNGRYEVHHGSIVEPSSDLETKGLALIIDGLSQLGDSRLERSVENLCGELGFEWLLVIQNEGGASALQAFTKCAEKFHYRSGAWQLGSSDSAVLLRRTERSASRSGGDRHVDSRQVETKLFRKINLQPEQWGSTLEAFSLRTVDPKWLIYLPSGIASMQGDRADGLLEHPSAAFDYYRNEGIQRLVVEEKHMGSRAIVVVCRDRDAAEARFGKRELGCVYTRNGRPFFEDPADFLTDMQNALTRARFWKRFHTDWVCLDGEMLPWSVKAQRLISESHREILETADAVVKELERTSAQIGWTLGDSLPQKINSLERYRRLLEKYEGQIGSPISFAPFHLIASEGQAYFDKDHHWHMRTLNGLARRAGNPFVKTRYEAIDLRKDADCTRVLDWWNEISEAGEEGLVVKPLHFVSAGRRGRAQPAVKCRTKEHLRLVYGHDYDEPENRLRLLDRPALARRRQKHRRVLRQFALSMEAVERFIRKEELGRVEECVRGVLALETREVFPEEPSL